jgi:hypothetical protein
VEDLSTVQTVGLLCTILGVVLCLKGLGQWRGEFAARGAFFLFIGGVALGWHEDLARWLPTGNDRLSGAMRERAEVEHSLRRKVLPLIAHCEDDLRRNECVVAATTEEERQRIDAERTHILAVLEKAQTQKAEHEKALAELNATIAGLEREKAVTQVKDVTAARAAARVAFQELRPTTFDATPVRSER